MSTTAPSPGKPSPPSKPIDILPTQLSQLYTNLHPILLLSILIFSFPSLVRDPINTLLGIAPTTTILQAFYCVLCLPSSNQAAPGSSTTTRPGQKKKPVKPAQDVWAKTVPAFLSLLLTLTLSTPILYLTLTLFGAPLTTHIPHTLLLALHLALLTTPQLYYTHGLEPQTWFRIASLQLPVDEVFGMTLGALLGAWVGAVPIPLDWDREWQRWPVTVLVGAYAGAVVGKVVGGYVCKGWKIKMS